MADGDLGDKTEPASPRRRREAHEEGSIPRSMDLSASITLLGAIILLVWLTPYMMRDLGVYLREALRASSADVGTQGYSGGDDLQRALKILVSAAAPFAGLMFVVGYLSTVWQVGWTLTAKPLQPKLSKLDPIGGFKKFFNAQAAGRAGMSIGKVILILLVSVIYVSRRFTQILMLPRLGYAEAFARSGWYLVELLLWLAAILIILGILDYAFQKWQWERQNRMSKHEVKEELRMTMGDPLVKQRQRSVARKMLSQRLQQSVPKADVVVTNPEHLSIALKWDPAAMHAPQVVAKGADHIALKIRQIAIAHRIPIVERKPLARAMYPVVHVGQEIPSNFFQAVAEVLAYVYRLNGKKAG